jgi:chromosomal replication initiation ATPase DnaA
MTDKDLHLMHIQLLEIGKKLDHMVGTVETELTRREHISMQSLEADKVLAAVEKEFGMPREVFCRKDASREVLIVRQTAQYLLREILHHSFPTVARLTGLKDHTTIMHSIKCVRDRRSVGPEYDAQIRRLYAAILEEEADDDEPSLAQGQVEVVGHQ